MMSSDLVFYLAMLLVVVYLFYYFIVKTMPKIFAPFFDLSTGKGTLAKHMVSMGSFFSLTEVKLLPLIYGALCVLLIIFVLN